MSTHFSDFAEVNVVKETMDLLFAATCIPIEVLDTLGTQIFSTSQQAICTSFHQKSLQTKDQCCRKNIDLIWKLKESSLMTEDGFLEHRCDNGMVEYIWPIQANEKTVGFSFVGQFFLSPPDKSFFTKQSQKYKFAERSYLNALADVPQFSSQEIKAVIKIQVKLIETFIAMTRRSITQQDIKNALRKSKRLLKSVLDHTDNAIMTLDSNRRVTYYNQQYIELYPFEKEFLALRPTMEDIIHKACEKGFYPIEEVDALIERRLIHLEQPGDDNIIETPRLDGVLVEGFSNKLPDGGYLLSFRDISSRKKNIDDHRRSSQLAALGTIAAGVAHEINNPIQGVINYATLIKNSPENAERNLEVAKRIIMEADRIANLTKDLLLCARDNHNERTTTNIAELTTRTIALIETKARRKGIGIEVNVEDNLPLVIVCPQEVQQIILNLTDNAYDALRLSKTPPSHPIINVNVSLINCEAPQLSIEVFDRGMGMPRHVLQKAKNVFFTTKSSSEGTGLGLSIVNDIVAKYNGSFDIDSERGEFTKAMVSIPVQLSS